MSVMSLVLTLCNELKEMKTLVKDQSGKLGKEVHREITRINENIDSKLTPLVLEVKRLRENLKKCEDKIYDMEKDKRKRNILIHGINIHRQTRTETQLKHFFRENLQMILKTEDIDFIKELGRDKKGPILLGLTSWRKKTEIMKNARKLKGSNMFISEDLSPEVLLTRKTLVPEMMNYRMQGHHAIIKYDKLYVNGEDITISNPSASTHIEQRKKISNIADCEIGGNTKSKKDNCQPRTSTQERFILNRLKKRPKKK
ncbi:hypothetical protein WDU94_006604 [Cyamophila willieti]